MRLILAGLVWAFEIEAVREIHWVRQKTNLVWQKEPFEVQLRNRVQVQGSMRSHHVCMKGKKTQE